MSLHKPPTSDHLGAETEKRKNEEEKNTGNDVVLLISL